MKKALPWLALFGAVGLWIYSRSRNVVNTINVAIKGVSVNLKAANVFQVPINVTITISNGSMIAANFSSFTGDLLYNGKVIGRINYLQPISIKATSAQDITIPVNISTTSGGLQLISILTSGIKNIAVSINGTLTSGAGNIPINTAFVLR